MQENEIHARIADVTDKIVASHFTEDLVAARAKAAGLDDPVAQRLVIFDLAETRAFVEELLTKLYSDKELNRDEPKI